MKYLRILWLPIFCFGLVLAGCSAAERQPEETEQPGESVHSDLKALLEQNPSDSIDFSYGIDAVNLIRWNTFYSEPVLPVHAAEVTEGEIADEIETFLSEHKTCEPVTDRLSQEGDRIAVALTGVWDGKTVYEETHVEFPIGSSGMPKAFDKGLEGVKIGDTVSLDVKYPEDYPEKDLQKQTVHFEIQILDLNTVSMPDYTDEWICANTDYDSIEAFEKAVCDRKKEQKMEIALRQWIESNTELIDCPDELLKAYQEDEIRQYTDIARYSYDMDLESLLKKMGYASEADFLADNDNDIKRSMKNDMAVFDIVQKENITATVEEYVTYLKTFAAEFGCKDTEELLDIYTEKEMRLKFMKQLVYRWLSERVTWKTDK